MLEVHLDGLLIMREKPTHAVGPTPFQIWNWQRPFCNSAGSIIWNISDSEECGETHSHFGSSN